MRPFDAHIHNQDEPFRSIMLYLKSVIKRYLPDAQEKFRYGIPFIHFDGKPLCYFNVLKNTNYVDVAFVQGILLEADFPMLKDGRNRKQVRSIALYKIEDLDEKEFHRLLIAASESLKNSKKAWFLD